MEGIGRIEWSWDMIVMLESFKEITELAVYLEGSGDPKDDHKIIGISWKEKGGMLQMLGITPEPHIISEL